jgi:hypothetical protein
MYFVFYFISLHLSIRFEPYVPSLASWSNYSTKDRIIGLTLHCFILSAMVLGVVLAKASWFCIKFFCFVLINYAVFRGEIVVSQPINGTGIGNLRHACRTWHAGEFSTPRAIHYNCMCKSSLYGITYRLFAR